MSDKFTVSFDKSEDDIPVLIVMKEGYSSYLLGPTMNIKKVITGDRAQQLYDELTGKKEEENHDKEH